MSMNTRRFAVALGTGALLAGGLTVLGVPAAQAGTITPTVKCSLPAGQGEKSGPQSITIDAPATAKPGETVPVKVTLGPSPATSPLAQNGIQLKPSIDFTLSGGATGSVTVEGPEMTVDVPANTPIQTPVYSGTLTIPATASGTVDLTPVRTVTVTKLSFGTFTTPCDITSGAAVVSSVAVEQAPPETATLGTASATVEPGAAVALSGLNWTPGSTATPSLCAADGSGCDAAGFSANTLAIGADGLLSGNATLAATAVEGTYTVSVTDGARTATTPLTVKKAEVPVAQRKITLDRSSIRAWSWVKVTGENFTPYTIVAIAGVNGANPTFNFGLAYTDKNGKFCSYILVTSKKTTLITGVEIDTTFKFDKIAMAPITVK